MDQIERFNLMMREVGFRAHHYRSMARMMQLVSILQLFIFALVIQPQRWRVHWWLAVVQVASFGFSIWMMGRSWRTYSKRARQLSDLEKAMKQFWNSKNESQLEAAQEQVQAAFENL